MTKSEMAVALNEKARLPGKRVKPDFGGRRA